MSNKILNSLRERLGLKPLNPNEVLRLRRDVEEVLQALPEVRRWRESCRSVPRDRDCDRDVFDNCKRCDRLWRQRNE